MNTVVLGKVRAKQYYEDDHTRSRSMPILLHGDGAFSGQGIVYETLDMSGLVDYTVGGTIHIVVNNQVRGGWEGGGGQGDNCPCMCSLWVKGGSPRGWY